MNRMLWGWIIVAGLLLARLGYMALETDDGSSPELTVLVLLTGGLLIGLFGITGLLGMLGWVPRPGGK